MLHDAGRFLALVNPAIALLLALCFLFAWHHERTRPHLLQLGACYLLAAAAIGAARVRIGFRHWGEVRWGFPEVQRAK